MLAPSYSTVVQFMLCPAKMHSFSLVTKMKSLFIVFTVSCIIFSFENLQYACFVHILHWSYHSIVKASLFTHIALHSMCILYTLISVRLHCLCPCTVKLGPSTPLEGKVFGHWENTSTPGDAHAVSTLGVLTCDNYTHTFIQLKPQRFSVSCFISTNNIIVGTFILVGRSSMDQQVSWRRLDCKVCSTQDCFLF